MTSRTPPSPQGGPGSLASLAAITRLCGALLAVRLESPAQGIPLPPPDQAQQMLQQAVQQTPGLAEVIRQRIQSSGMTPDQVRARLAAGGYPPDLLDAYMSGGGGSGQAAVGPKEQAAGLALGLWSNAPRPPTLPVFTGQVRTAPARGRPDSRPGGHYVFRAELFRRGTAQS